jgi:hypothetical protein
MKLEIDVERWTEALGPGVMLMAYFDTNNGRDWDRWNELVDDEATHTANVDTSGLSVRKLKPMVLDGILGSMPDIEVVVSNVFAVSPTVAFAEWETEGTLTTGAKYENCGFIKFELNDEGTIQNVRVAELSIDAVDLLREAGGVVPDA